VGDRRLWCLLRGHNGVAVIERICQGPLEAEGDGQSRARERLAIGPDAFQGFLSLVQHRARVVTKDACQGNRLCVLRV
jgi:hypothetical protein